MLKLLQSFFSDFFIELLSAIAGAFLFIESYFLIFVWITIFLLLVFLNRYRQRKKVIRRSREIFSFHVDKISHYWYECFFSQEERSSEKGSKKIWTRQLQKMEKQIQSLDEYGLEEVEDAYKTVQSDIRTGLKSIRNTFGGDTEGVAKILKNLSDEENISVATIHDAFLSLHQAFDEDKNNLEKIAKDVLDEKIIDGKQREVWKNILGEGEGAAEEDLKKRKKRFQNMTKNQQKKEQKKEQEWVEEKIKYRIVISILAMYMGTYATEMQQKNSFDFSSFFHTYLQPIILTVLLTIIVYTSWFPMGTYFWSILGERTEIENELTRRIGEIENRGSEIKNNEFVGELSKIRTLYNRLFDEKPSYKTDQQKDYLEDILKAINTNIARFQEALVSQPFYFSEREKIQLRELEDKFASQEISKFMKTWENLGVGYSGNEGSNNSDLKGDSNGEGEREEGLVEGNQGIEYSLSAAGIILLLYFFIQTSLVKLPSRFLIKNERDKRYILSGSFFLVLIVSPLLIEVFVPTPMGTDAFKKIWYFLYLLLLMFLLFQQRGMVFQHYYTIYMCNWDRALFIVPNILWAPVLFTIIFKMHPFLLYVNTVFIVGTYIYYLFRSTVLQRNKNTDVTLFFKNFVHIILFAIITWGVLENFQTIRGSVTSIVTPHRAEESFVDAFLGVQNRLLVDLGGAYSLEDVTQDLNSLYNLHDSLYKMKESSRTYKTVDQEKEDLDVIKQYKLLYYTMIRDRTASEPNKILTASEVKDVFGKFSEMSSGEVDVKKGLNVINRDVQEFLRPIFFVVKTCGQLQIFRRGDLNDEKRFETIENNIFSQFLRTKQQLCQEWEQKYAEEEKYFRELSFEKKDAYKKDIQDILKKRIEIFQDISSFCEIPQKNPDKQKDIGRNTTSDPSGRKKEQKENSTLSESQLLRLKSERTEGDERVKRE
jgi:hypothetical protein